MPRQEASSSTDTAGGFGAKAPRSWQNDETVEAIEALRSLSRRNAYERFKQLPKDMRNTKEVAITAVKQKGEALEYCSEELRDDKEVVLEAVKQNGGALVYCSTNLRDDTEVALEALRTCRYFEVARIFELCSMRLRNDETVKAIKALRRLSGGSACDFFKQLPTDMQNKKEVAMTAVQQAGYCRNAVLSGLSEELRGNKELALEAIKKCSFAFRDCSSELRNDKSFGIEVITENVNAFRCCSDELRNDKSFGIEAVKKHWFAIRDCSDTLRNDKDVAMEAVKQNGQALEYCSETLRNDMDVGMEALEHCDRLSVRNVFRFLSKELRNNKELAIKAVKKGGEVIGLCSETLRNDKDVAMEAVRQNGRALRFASLELRADREVVFEAARQNREAYEFAALDAKTDPLLQEAIASRIASPGSRTPVCIIKMVTLVEHRIEYQASLGLGGDEINDELGQDATLGDVALRLSNELASSFVCIIGPVDYEPISPFDCLLPLRSLIE